MLGSMSGARRFVVPELIAGVIRQPAPEGFRFEPETGKVHFAGHYVWKSFVTTQESLSLPAKYYIGVEIRKDEFCLNPKVSRKDPSKQTVHGFYPFLCIGPWLSPTTNTAVYFSQFEILMDGKQTTLSWEEFWELTRKKKKMAVFNAIIEKYKTPDFLDPACIEIATPDQHKCFYGPCELYI